MRSLHLLDVCERLVAGGCQRGMLLAMRSRLLLFSLLELGGFCASLVPLRREHLDLLRCGIPQLFQLGPGAVALFRNGGEGAFLAFFQRRGGRLSLVGSRSLRLKVFL